jgi:putative hydrolase of the HAD superfamily
MTNRRRFEFLICDLDDTLYPASSGAMHAIGERIHQYMVEYVGISPKLAPQIRIEYRDRYGTSLQGLIADYGIDPGSYLDYVHDLPLERFLQPNPALDAVLARIPLTKAVFTNASDAHARRVLDRLGVSHHFGQIVHVLDFDARSKPDPFSYQRLLEILSVDPRACIFVEDSARNLAPAMQMGMLGVLVGNNHHRSNHAADIQINKILELADALSPWLPTG